MRALTATLAAACRKLDAEPIVRVRIADTPLEAPRLDLTQLYSEASLDTYHDAAVAKDGSLVRARATGGRLYMQRVTTPTTASQWSTWTDLTAATAAPVAIAADSLTAAVIVYYVSGTQIRYSESLDYGATWSADALVHDPGAPIGGLAADGRYGYQATVFAAVNAGAGVNYVARAYWTGAAWAWDPGAANRTAIDGIGVGRDSTAPNAYCYLVIADGTTPRISYQEHDGINWQGGAVIIQAGASSPYDYAHPRLLHQRPADSLDRHCLTLVERCSAPAYQRALISFTPVRWWLSETVPWDHTTTYGVVILRTASWWYLIQSDRAHRAPAYTGASGQLLDVSQDAVTTIAAVEQLNHGGELLIELDNSAGTYATAGQAGALRPLRTGSQLALGLGYRTTGVEYIWTSTWWIRQIGFADRGARGTGALRITCIDTAAWHELLRARRQYQWSGDSLGSIIQKAWWCVCGEASGSPSGNMALTVPQFSVQAGASWGAAARRLVESSGLDLRFTTAAAVTAGVGLTSVDPEVIDHAQGASAYSYGPATHPPLSGVYMQSGQIAGHVDVVGLDLLGRWLDWSRILDQWRDLPRTVIDRSLDAQAEVDTRATYEGLRLQADEDLGLIVARVNPGLQVGDVIDLTDSRAGLAATLRHVREIRTRYNRSSRPHFDQEIRLGGIAT